MKLISIEYYRQPQLFLFYRMIFNSRYLKNSFFIICFISMLASCKHVEHACFNYYPEAPDTSTIVYFDPSCTDLAFTYKWSFGDGTPDSTILGQAVPIGHKYSAPGTYTVVLNAVRKDGVSFRKGKTQVSEKVVVH